MTNTSFKALLVSESSDKEFQSKVVTRQVDELPIGDLLIHVKYSSLNYKDALSAKGNRGVTRNYPHTPGIDAAGIVQESQNPNFKIGDQVIVTGFDLGMNTSGGFGQYIRIPSQWAIKLPKNLTLRESMIYGTAGLTAALSIYKLIESGVSPSDGQILVTGATGGVGSIAIGILNKLGFKVIAATGKMHERDRLLRMGAEDVVDRHSLEESNDRVLLKERWAGVVDTVGGSILSNAIKATTYGGSVTCCGNVASHNLSSSIYPFILRGVTLFGIDSVQCPLDIRHSLWKHLSSDWKPNHLNQNVHEVSLDELGEEIELIISGKHVGRTIVNLEH